MGLKTDFLVLRYFNLMILKVIRNILKLIYAYDKPEGVQKVFYKDFLYGAQDLPLIKS